MTILYSSALGRTSHRSSTLHDVVKSFGSIQLRLSRARILCCGVQNRRRRRTCLERKNRHCQYLVRCAHVSPQDLNPFCNQASSAPSSTLYWTETSWPCCTVSRGAHESALHVFHCSIVPFKLHSLLLQHKPIQESEYRIYSFGVHLTTQHPDFVQPTSVNLCLVTP
jgi:hypothetical protein